MNYRGTALSSAKRARKQQSQSWRVRLANWLTRNEDDMEPMFSSVNEVQGIDRGNGTVTFTIHPASGGYVVESSYYDERKDRHERSLHIITSQENFSEELGKAVFMDVLKNR